jgi:hypothetical protein
MGSASGLFSQLSFQTCYVSSAKFLLHVFYFLLGCPASECALPEGLSTANISFFIRIEASSHAHPCMSIGSIMLIYDSKCSSHLSGWASALVHGFFGSSLPGLVESS